MSLVRHECHLAILLHLLSLFLGGHRVLDDQLIRNVLDLDLTMEVILIDLFA